MSGPLPTHTNYSPALTLTSALEVDHLLLLREERAAGAAGAAADGSGGQPEEEHPLTLLTRYPPLIPLLLLL